jgi:predicted metal-dependent enzyme (double-stranded beta helix superfamily)
MIGVMRGAEMCEQFELEPTTANLNLIGSHLLPNGTIDLVSPRIGDIHKVSNALNDDVSISIHIYGANVGTVKRHVYDLNTGHKKPFISGYSNKTPPANSTTS